MHLDNITKAFQWDLARQVERLDVLLRLLPRYAGWGYQELYLHLENAVEYPSLPGVARRDAYSYRQFARLVDAATRVGISVVPIVNLLGHTQYLIKVPELRDLNELRDASGQPLDRGQICPLHPRTLEIAGKLLGDMAPFCTAGKVHVGLDESFLLGQCPRCRADVSRRGLAAHFAGHAQQLHRLAAGMGLRMGLWADMLALLPAAIPLLPRDLAAYDWCYYPFARHPRVELRNFAEIDLAAPLQARGIEYWGCPMNGAFRYEPMPAFSDRLANILSWWKRCRRVGATGFLVTSWEANRLAFELTTAVNAAAACLWLEPGIEDPKEMLARGFARTFGRTGANRDISSNAPGGRGLVEGEAPDGPNHVPVGAARQVPRPPSHAPRPMASCPTAARRWARAALACDEHAFAGYHRWQINDRWDVCAGRDGVAQYERELRALERICRSLLAGDPSNNRLQAGSYMTPPPALRASVAFRLYLARRDVFVRRNAQAVFQLRRMSSAGPRPASGSWPIRDGAGLRPAFDPSRRSETGATLALLRTEASAFAAAIRAGQAAARAMWNLSRSHRQRGPNELMLDRDLDRLRQWTRWLKDAARNPDLIRGATPVCGAWQLQFTVHNFAPAMQKVVVEQQKPDGTWEMIHSLHTIEFQAAAARPRSKLCREISVPIPVAASASERKPEDSPLAGARGHPILPLPPADGQGDSMPPLRIAVRGLGQVGISRVELTDGVLRLRPVGKPWNARHILGRPASRRGFPSVEFETDAAAIEFRFDR